MLHDLIEAEGPAAIQATNAPQPTRAILSGLDYVFSGQSPDRPGIWLAGGITRQGQSVSGVGPSRDAALQGVAGETAELDRRAVAGMLETGVDWGFGAHPDPDRAMAHARAEVIERASVLHWWRGGGGATVLPARRAGTDPGQPRDLGLISLPAPAGASVVMALSFGADGQCFCFGAACRPDAERAGTAAIAELAQAEFGLRLATARQARGATLAAPDEVTLRLAQFVHRDHIHHYVKTAGAAAGVSALMEKSWSNMRMKSLGVFADQLHVQAAHLLAATAGEFPFPGPYADLPLYRG